MFLPLHDKNGNGATGSAQDGGRRRQGGEQCNAKAGRRWEKRKKIRARFTSGPDPSLLAFVYETNLSVSLVSGAGGWGLVEGPGRGFPRAEAPGGGGSGCLRHRFTYSFQILLQLINHSFNHSNSHIVYGQYGQGAGVALRMAAITSSGSDVSDALGLAVKIHAHNTAAPNGAERWRVGLLLSIKKTQLVRLFFMVSSHCGPAAVVKRPLARWLRLYA